MFRYGAGVEMGEPYVVLGMQPDKPGTRLSAYKTALFLQQGPQKQ